MALILASTLSAVQPLPLSFVPASQLHINGGNSAVEWEAHGKNYGLFLDESGATLRLHANGPVCAADASIRLDLVGATARKLEPLELLPGVVHSYVGPRESWRENLPTFAKVAHNDAWPGIDVVYYGTEGRLEIDFVVQPGADLNRVAFDVAGARVDARGTLHVAAGGGEVTLPPPVLYQLLDGERQQVTGRYLRRADGNIGFSVGPHDAALPLVIDPIVVYSSYFGGNGDEFVNGCAVSSSGELFIVGYTTSTDFPLPTPSPAPPFNQGDGNGNAFVSKVSSSGQQILYSLYLGGSGFDTALAVALDGSGNAFVTGSTESPSDFPLKHAFQGTFGGGGQDAFVAMFNSSGVLQYSSFLGSTGASDVGNGIAVDSVGAAYVGGTTDTQFPKAGGGFLTGDATPDGFIVKLNTFDGSNPPTLVYSRLFHGSGTDQLMAVAVDSNKAAYLAGFTDSNDFPTCLPGPCVSPSPAAMRPGGQDLFVGKVSADGSQLGYMRLIGGAADEEPAAIRVDTMGAAYVAGFTESTDYPTINAIQSTYHAGGTNGQDAFLTKLAPDGTSLIYSTFLGGSGDDQAFSLAVDSNGVAYVGGVTASTNFPVTSTAVESTLPNAGGSGFAMRITSSGSGISWSTFFGGTTSTSNVIGLGTDLIGNVYAGGYTDADNMPLVNPLMGRKLGFDAFILKLGPSSEQPFISFITPPSAPANSNTSVTITGANFTAGTQVFFDGVMCLNIMIASNGETITCTTPLHAAGTVTVAVTNTDGRTGTKPFTFDPPSAPTLTSITPNMGPISGGTTVTISGAKIGASATVTFGGTAATNVSVVNSTQITASTPAHAAGAVDVVVSNGTGLDTTLTGGFTYVTTASDAPTVSTIAPNSGPTAGGTSVAILGNHFATGATVQIGGNDATSIKVVNDTTITAVTPAGTAGAADVTVKNPNGQSGTLTGGFTYGSSSNALALLAVNPNIGNTSGGESVTLIGANFTGDEAVTFGGAAATGVAMTDPSRLSVITPAHASGAVDVVVTAKDGQTATLSGGFTYRHATGGSCSCDLGGRSEVGGWWLMLLLAMLLLRRARLVVK
jgi:hypothetical protein